MPKKKSDIEQGSVERERNQRYLHSDVLQKFCGKISELNYLKFALCSWSDPYYNPCLSLLLTDCYTKKVSTLLINLNQETHKQKKYNRKNVESTMTANLTSTFPLTDVPIGRGLTVTVPFKASSSTLADIVVLIGTPSLL